MGESLETTAACPACGAEQFRAERTYRDYRGGRILRDRYCPTCNAEWQTEERFVRMLK